MGRAVIIIGGGLAGCEAAAAAARLGMDVTLHEMKPVSFSPAHRLPALCELVCSNSLKSTSLDNASGLLKEEMRRLGSIVVEAAEATSVPAGGALGVDRERFAALVTEKLANMGVNVVRGEVRELPAARPLVIATGPLTSGGFARELEGFLGSDSLFFYDAISPVVYRDSIDFGVAFMASRYGRGGADYVNCPMTGDEYERFVSELANASKTPLRGFEKMPFFEGCMPIEAMAERGPDTLAYGPLRPVGFTDPRTGLRPHAVVQLRRENMEDTLYNMVGFQTRLTRPEQKRVISMIPGLNRVEFARYGSIHRNSYVNSPGLLIKTLQLKKDGETLLAGQITGVEGYCESAATGIIAGMNAFLLAGGREPVCPPPSTMTGALLHYITEPGRTDFQPMNANFGIIEGYRKRSGRAECAQRALRDIEEWKNGIANPAV